MIRYEISAMKEDKMLRMNMIITLNKEVRICAYYDVTNEEKETL